MKPETTLKNEGHSIKPRGPLDYPPETNLQEDNQIKGMMDFAVSLPEYKGLQTKKSRETSNQDQSPKALDKSWIDGSF